MASDAALNLIISLKDEASKGLDGIANKASFLSTAFGVFTGGAVLAGVQRVSGAVTGFLGDAIQESRDAAHGLAQTEAVIKSTGGAAGVTAQQIVDMAGSLSHATLFTDDAIQADQNLLLTFTNLKNGVGAGNDIFNQATKISLDLATAMGTDAAGGAIQLGKALNDPTAGISALTRVGVTFSDQQKEQIKTLQKSGDLMGAQKIILAELNKEFGGSAAAAAQADGGYHLFQQRLSDVKQTIGDALQPALQGIMGLLSGPFLDVVETAGTWLSDKIATGVQWLTTTGLPLLTSTITSLWNAAQVLITGDFSGGIFGLDEDSSIISFLLSLHDAFANFTDGNISAGLEDLGVGLGDLLRQLGVSDEIASAVDDAFFHLGETFNIIRDGFITFVQALQGNWSNSDQILLVHQAFGELGLLVRNEVIPAIQSIIGFIGNNLQPILVGLGAALTAIVIPAFVAWAAASITAAAGTIAALAPVVVPIAAIGIAAAALYAAWNTNFLGIRDTLTTVWGVVLPVLQSLQTWLATTIPPTITALSQLWSGTLLPAITSVWSFIQDNIFPLLGALANVWIALVKLELTALAGLWQNVLLPAITAVWAYFNDNIVPILSSVATTISTVLSPAVSTTTGFFNTWYTAIGGISGAIQTVITWLNNLATTLSSLHLPDWLTPGSPTPFEYGLRGIADAAYDASRAVGDLGKTLGFMGAQSPGGGDILDHVKLIGPGGSGMSIGGPSGGDTIGQQLVGSLTDQLPQWQDAWQRVQDNSKLSMDSVVNIVHLAHDHMADEIRDLVERIDDAYNRANALRNLSVTGGSGGPGSGGGSGGGGGGSGIVLNVYGNLDGDSTVAALRSVGLG